MDCKYAYTEAAYEYILCKLETPPIHGDKKSYFHSLCSSQEFCPAKNCHKLSAEWKECKEHKEAARTPTTEATATKAKSKATKK